MQRCISTGASLIELIIVKAIIGILVAIVLPDFQEYAVRTKVIEGISIADAAKTAVIENASSY